MKLYEATEIPDLMMSLRTMSAVSAPGTVRLVRVHLADDRAFEALEDEIQKNIQENGQKALLAGPRANFDCWVANTAWPLPERGWIVQMRRASVSAQPQAIPPHAFSGGARPPS